MPDNVAIHFGDKRNSERVRRAQRTDDVLLVVAGVLRFAKGGDGDGFDGLCVSRGFGADQYV